jgi:hypothetical protein
MEHKALAPQTKTACPNTALKTYNVQNKEQQEYPAPQPKTASKAAT